MAQTPPPSWLAAARDILRPDWKQLHARPALRCLPCLFILLATGLFLPSRAQTAVAAAAAMSVGFGSFQSFRNSRLRIMLLVTGAITLAAFTGSLSSRSLVEVLVAAASWAFLYGLLAAVEERLSWIGLQAVVIAVVATGFPAGPKQALLRAALTLGGALLQTTLIFLIWRFFGPPREPVGAPLVSFPKEDSQQESLFQRLSLRSFRGAFVARLCVTLALAAATYQLLRLSNGYWIPMTAVIVLRPGLQQTFSRGLARVAGTLLGVGLASLLMVISRPHPAIIALLVLIFAWASYAMLRVNYAFFATCITAYVVFLLSFVGLPEKSIVFHRVVNTALGGAFALLASSLPLESWMRRKHSDH